MSNIYDKTIAEASKDNVHCISVLKATFDLLLNDKRVEHKLKNLNALLNPSLPLSDREKIGEALKKDMLPTSDLKFDIITVKKSLRDYNVSFKNKAKSSEEDLRLISLSTKIMNYPYFVFVESINDYLSTVAKIETCRKSQKQDMLLKAPQQEKQNLLEYRDEVLKIANKEKLLLNSNSSLSNEEEKNIDGFLIDCVDDNIEVVNYIDEFDKLFDNYEKNYLNDVISFINTKKKYRQVSTVEEAKYLLDNMRIIIKKIIPKLLVYKNSINSRFNNILESIGAFDFYKEYESMYNMLGKALSDTPKLSPGILVSELNREVKDLIIIDNIPVNSPEYRYATKYMNEEEISDLEARIESNKNISERVAFAKNIENIKKKTLI